MRVSSIIPAHGEGLFLERAIQSCLDQSEVFEVIIVNDGLSTLAENSLKKLSHTNENIKIFGHKENQNLGPAASRNLGIMKATQDYISFLDSDDYYVSDRFANTMKTFKNNPNVDGVYEAVQRISESDQQTSTLITMPPDAGSVSLFEIMLTSSRYWISLDGLTLKASCLNKEDIFDPGLRLSEDTDFVMRLLLNKKLVAGTIDRPVTMSSLHSTNVTKNTTEVNKYRYLLFNKWMNSTYYKNLSARSRNHLLRGFLYSKIEYRYPDKNIMTKRLLKLIELSKFLIFKPGLLNDIF